MTKEVWLERGRASRQAGRHIEPLKHFQAAIDLDGNCAAAWYGRAQSLEDLGRFQSALEALERAHELDPKGYSALALFEMGNCHVRLGRSPASASLL